MARAITQECIEDPRRCPMFGGKDRKKLFTGKVRDWIKDSFFSRSKSETGKKGYDLYKDYKEKYDEEKDKLKEEGFSNKEIKEKIGYFLTFDQFKKTQKTKKKIGFLDPDPVKEGYYSGEEHELSPKHVQRSRSGEGYPASYQSWYYSAYNPYSKGQRHKGTRKEYRKWKRDLDDKLRGESEEFQEQMNFKKGGYIGRAVR